MTVDLETFAPFEAHTLPDGSVIFYRDSSHDYYAEIHMPQNDWIGVQSERLTSVTTAIKPLDFDPDGLMSWAVSQYAAGLDWRSVRADRARVGTNVHKLALHALATGRPIPDFDRLTEDEHGYALGVMAFWHEHEPATELSEQIVYSKTHRVVGRLDLIAWMGDPPKRVMVDAKTKNGASTYVSAKHHGQLALYDHCAQECGVGATDEQYVLNVWPDGSYELVRCQATAEDALAALTVYRAAARINGACKRERAAA